ncbi:MAG: aminomethyl-transferring glycine dehydrogenase subunit GcvPB [Candidatus Cloacimonetes bacterium]|nr:aminomethyl-transferring glycine dehydrogenase subunit GcvPB [Candidatus Cloacimonadota bacterium]MBL7086364.1 aminomethyl-transferring glycine dehydrogenase subunit GcvPB [Candidatus Cloacimonadota bacterium]
MEPKTIFEKSVKGRIGYSLPECEIDKNLEDFFPTEILRKVKPNLPEVSELDAMRHYIEISAKNHFIEKGFYPLGSCTMKYNPKINDIVNTLLGLTNLHPYQPEDTIQGALQIMYELQNDLSEISGMAEVSLQPVAGAHSEFAGANIIYNYHKNKGNQKTKIIMPDSAHGTNPATSALHGYEVVEIKSNEQGKVDIDALKQVIAKDIAGFMLTNPNTLGVFETEVKEIAEIIHSVDGLMYMDGANLNAMLGYIRPGDIGVDIVHFNLHKTFSTPHGGGGPGGGGIGVIKKLVRFLPFPIIKKENDKYYFDYNIKNSIGKVHSFYGNFLVMVRAYIYLKMLGEKGLQRVAENAIINTNYLMKKLENYFPVPYQKDVMHEFVASGEKFKKYDVKTLDIAKRLLDYGFHAPTIYFPLIVHEALMIEPTETESKETLDSFIEAMIKISEEAESNPEKLKNAPENTPVGRLDETAAIKNLDVKFSFDDEITETANKR